MLPSHEDGVSVVIHQFSGGGIGMVDIHRVTKFTGRHTGLAECAQVVIRLYNLNLGHGVIGGQERDVVLERLRTFICCNYTAVYFGHIAGIQQLKSGQCGAGLLVVVDNGADVVRNGRQLHGKFTAHGIGFDGDSLHSIAAILRTAYICYAAVGTQGLIEQRIGILVEDALVLIEHHIHTACIGSIGAGEQCQCGGSDVGYTLSKAQRLVALHCSTDNTSGNNGLRYIGKRQVAYAVVIFTVTLGRIKAVILEGMVLMGYADNVASDAHRQAELTLTVAGDGAMLVFLQHIIHIEVTVLHGIGGILVIHNALHAEAADVFKIAGKLRGSAAGRNAFLWFVEAVYTLRRNDAIGRSVDASERDTLNVIVAVLVRQRVH